MQLIILKNGNAINVDKVKRIMIEDKGKICVDLNGDGIPVSIYNRETSFEYKEFKKKHNWKDDEGFVFAVVEQLYKNLNNFEFNVDMRSIENWAIYELEDKLIWN